jgi:uncharacterized membrane protein HdeD (DUF308 family)
MPPTLMENWWLLALRGLLAITLGILAIFWPGFAWLYVVVTFAVYAMADGVFAIAAAIRGQVKGGWWWAFILQGIVGIAAGVLAIFYPGLTTLVFLVVIAWWAILIGILQVVAAIRLRREIQGEWLLAISGLLSLAFGIGVLIVPNAGALAIAMLLAAFWIAFGIILISLALQLRPKRIPVHHHDTRRSATA